MAELHRRVLGLSNSPALALLLAALVLAPLRGAAQEGASSGTAWEGATSESTTSERTGDDEAPRIISRRELERWADDLRSRNESARRRAVEVLGSLPLSALPAVRDRLNYLRRRQVPEDEGYDALRSFRHAVGSRRADDAVDIAPGILPTLAERRTPVVGHVAERLLLLRSLMEMGTLDAQRTMGDVFALTPRMWRWESRRVVQRMGRALLPGLIVARAHRELSVRRWSSWGVSELGLGEPGMAVQGLSPSELAPLLEAYGEVRDLDAMPVVISFVDHDDEALRHAARAATARFRRNAIWKLREAYRNRLGTDADSAWGWRTTMERLYAGLDERRLAPATEALDAGLAALTGDDFETAERSFARALLLQPEHPRRAEMAPGYARLATVRPGRRIDYLRRSLLLAPDSPEAGRWQAGIVFAEAEARRAQWTFDAGAYREVLRQQPDHAEARALLEEFAGEAPPVEVSVAEPLAAASGSVTPHGYFAAGLALVLTFLLGVAAWWNRRAIGGALQRSRKGLRTVWGRARRGELRLSAAGLRRLVAPGRAGFASLLARGVRAMGHGALRLAALFARGGRAASTASRRGGARVLGVLRPLGVALASRAPVRSRAHLAGIGARGARAAERLSGLVRPLTRRVGAAFAATGARLMTLGRTLDGWLARVAESASADTRASRLAERAGVEHAGVERAGVERAGVELTGAGLSGAGTSTMADAELALADFVGPATLAELEAVHEEETVAGATMAEATFAGTLAGDGPQTLSGGLDELLEPESEPSEPLEETRVREAEAGMWLLHAAQRAGSGRHDSSAGTLAAPRS